MRLVRRLVSVAAVGAALALTFAVPSYAGTTHIAAAVQTTSITIEAAPLLSAGCPAGKVCIYADANFVGGPGVFSGTNSDWGADFGSSDGACVAGSTAAGDNKGGWNDCASSIINNTGVTFWFYINADCSPIGSAFPLPSGYQVANLNTAFDDEPTGFYNDAITSDSASRDPISC